MGRLHAKHYGHDSLHEGFEVDVCTPDYRAPDAFLGNSKYGTDLDMWSLGCVIAELLLRVPLFNPRLAWTTPEQILKSHLDFLGGPTCCGLNFLSQLPFFDRYCPGGLPVLKAATREEHLPQSWAKGPAEAKELIDNLLRWLPGERPSALAALRHHFITPLPLGPSVVVQAYKNGFSSIATGHLQPDVLHYLQNDPEWAACVAESRRTNFKPNHCMGSTEGQHRNKAEFPAYVDANAPPKSLKLCGDALAPIKFMRIAQFMKALKHRNRSWLHQLSGRLRKAIYENGLPAAKMANGKVFLMEELVDLAWVYASTQVMKIGARSDGWHTDGGASLLHAGLTVFGSRTLEVKFNVHHQDQAGDCVSLPQVPGSFYIGNFCALLHNVRHGTDSPGSFGADSDSNGVQIAVMFRTDVFRDARARNKNARPGPQSLYDVVNTETAKHMAEVPFDLPDLSDVLAE